MNLNPNTTRRQRTDDRMRYPVDPQANARVGIVRGLPDTYEMDAWSPWASRSTNDFTRQVEVNTRAAQVLRTGMFTVRPPVLGQVAYDPLNPAGWTDKRD